MRIFAFLFSALLCVGLAPNPTDPIVELTFLNGGQSSSCTGFHINPLQIVTAGHCVPDGPMLANGSPVRMIRSNPRVALYESSVVRRGLRFSDPVLGETTTVTGNAWGLGLISIQRQIVKLIDADGDLWMDGPVIPGMSGGPLVNDDGKVVGMVQSSTPMFSFASPSKEIRDFLK